VIGTRISTHGHYLEEGVDFWWNDEGETYYFAFYYWNLAQQGGLAKFDKKKRFWTINRSYSAGMSRMGAVIWTGDIPVAWEALAQQPGYVLNWHMAGVGFVTCDSGGFNGPNDTPLLLVRWYQYAVFMPIMRVHSTKDDLPHFPFLYGDVAGAAMRKALNLRYQLLPYHYSLSHQAYRSGGVSIMRPLLWSYPDDPVVAEMTTQWFDGEHLMAAPVLNQDNVSDVYLPAGVWYSFNSSTAHVGPTNVTSQAVALDATPVFVRAGGIITIGPVVQHVGQLPGGPLEVQVYTGASGSFTLFEDDGETTDYQSEDAVRATTFEWDDTTATLKWTVVGEKSYNGPSCYLHVNVVAFSQSDGRQAADTATLGKDGSVTFPKFKQI